MEYRVTRVCGEGWFADVPTGYEWVGEGGTSIEVRRPPEAGDSAGDSAEERLELVGRVLVRGDANTVVSCGGLIVSLPSSTVGDADELCVMFTREELGAGA